MVKKEEGKKWWIFEFKFKITFTNFVGCALLAISAFKGFDTGIWAGVVLMGSRKIADKVNIDWKRKI